MKQVMVVERGNAKRDQAERFIRDVYANEYGARVPNLADRLLCRFGDDGHLLCAAGLRLASEGFFSERYLDQPVEGALRSAVGAASGRDIRRSDIFEVTTLASCAPRDLADFIGDIVQFGAQNGLSWCFFTLTQRLSQLVARRHLSPIYLADATADKVADPALWGSYYSHEPKVYGVCGINLFRALAPSLAEARYAGAV